MARLEAINQENGSSAMNRLPWKRAATLSFSAIGIAALALAAKGCIQDRNEVVTHESP